MNKKYAILSDIHGNSWALKAVLDDIMMKEIQIILNLGDIFYGPLDPEGTAEILQQYSIETVQGNQDRIIYESMGLDSDNPTLDYVLNQLTGKQIDWLKNLPKTRVIDNKIFLCHGTPANDEAYLIDDIGTGIPYLKPTPEIEVILQNIKHPVILCGHSHIARSVYLTNKQLIINPGSVGLPSYEDDFPIHHKMESGSPHASYVILTKTNKEWNIEHIRVTYNWGKAAQKAEKNNRKDWAYWLRTGRS